jgi:hypothetical protein
MTRNRLVSPTVGFTPAKLFLEDGLIIDPDVSEPRAAMARPMLEDTAEPEELPDGSCSG